MRPIIIAFCMLVLHSCNNNSNVVKISKEDANMLITETIARCHLFEKNDGKTKVFRDELHNYERIIESENDVIELSKFDIFKNQRGIRFLKMDSIEQLNIQSFHEISIRSAVSESISIFYSHSFRPPKGVFSASWMYVTYWYRFKLVNGKWKFRDLEIMDGESD